MITVTKDQIVKLAPRIKSNYLIGLDYVQAALDRYEVTKTSNRVAHFWAQILHESTGLTALEENLNYSAEGLVRTWPNHFPPKGTLDPNKLAHHPEMIANEMYGHRMGNLKEGDGWKYRGRGGIQITGYESYVTVTKLIKLHVPDVPDFSIQPDLVIDPKWIYEVIAAKWYMCSYKGKSCNEWADSNNIEGVTRAINGGILGLKERTNLFSITSKVWPL